MITGHTTATDWQERFISDCVTPFEVERGKKVLAREYKPAGKFPIVDQGQQLVAGYTDDESAVIRDELPLVVFGDHTRVFKFVDFPFVVGADGTKLLKPKSGLDPKFFYFACLSLDIPTRGYNRHFKILREQTIRYPEKSEQEKIAAVLWKIQKAVEIEDAIVRNARDLKRSLRRRLFTHGLRGEPLKETEIGPVPQSWEVASIADLTTLVYRYPTYYNITYVTHGVPEVRGELLRDNGLINNKAEALRFITEETAARFPQVRLSCGDIVMSVRGTMGKIGLVEEVLSGAVITANLIRLATNQSIIVPDFFRWALLSDGFQARLDAASSKTTIHTIPAPDLKRLQIPLPEISEQREIANILQTADRKIDIHESKKRSLQDLFKTTLHKLMAPESASTIWT